MQATSGLYSIEIDGVIKHHAIVFHELEQLILEGMDGFRVNHQFVLHYR